jgi:hypothetical protein
MRRMAIAPDTRREARPGSGFRGLHEIVIADRSSGDDALTAGQLRMLRLQTAWARTIGAPLKEIARLRVCAGGRLVVDVPDALWKREMERIKPRILERLAREVPCAPVTDLSFFVRGRIPSPAAKPPDGAAEAPAARPTPFPLPERLSDALSSVSDTTLRGHLGEVMERYLSLQSPPG